MAVPVRAADLLNATTSCIERVFLMATAPLRASAYLTECVNLDAQCLTATSKGHQHESGGRYVQDLSAW